MSSWVKKHYVLALLQELTDWMLLLGAGFLVAMTYHVLKVCRRSANCRSCTLRINDFLLATI